ncbi:Protein SQS1 [Beauveria bassiana]|nr:Protein SQS1 [Beauveria bassiana]
MPISFKSAGFYEPLKSPPQASETDEHQSDAAIPSHDNMPKKRSVMSGHQSLHASLEGATSGEPMPDSEAAELKTSNLFYFSEVHCTSLNTHQPEVSTLHMPKENTLEHGNSDSEGEVILFKGRLNSVPKKSDTIDMENIRTEILAVQREVETSPVMTNITRGRRGGRQAKAKRAAIFNVSEEEDDGMLADYIANMRENGEMQELIETLAGPAEIEDESASSAESSDNDAGDLLTEAALASQLNKQIPKGASGETVTEYTDFDPMHWYRPSIQRNNGKAAKHKLDFRFADIDSEIECRLQAAWQSDRIRKAERKKEREQFRALNLIKKKAEKGDTDDLRVKYPKGMSLDQVADELKRFLISLDISICLPPMDKHARKIIHELANTFNVKSKSTGKADQRRPTLYRTKRTLRFDDEAFQSAVRRTRRRYFPRLDYKGKRLQGQPSRNGYAEASYRDGEIVGASAPELSIENRGRAMLEKMGWSTGTALGSEDNKGILIPVIQTMKRSKAGLG